MIAAIAIAVLVGALARIAWLLDRDVAPADLPEDLRDFHLHTGGDL